MVLQPVQRGHLVGCQKNVPSDLTGGILALFAQQEREANSRRTKGALAAAKARGVKLGTTNEAAALRRAGEDRAAVRGGVARNADDPARSLAPVLGGLRAEGVTSLRGMAGALNDRGMMSRGGRSWHVLTARNLLARLLI